MTRIPEESTTVRRAPRRPRILRLAGLFGKVPRRVRVALLLLTIVLLLLAFFFLPLFVKAETLQLIATKYPLSAIPAKTAFEITSFLDEHPVQHLEELGTFVDDVAARGGDPLQAKIPPELRRELCEASKRITAYGIRTDCIGHTGKRRSDEGDSEKEGCAIRYYDNVQIWDFQKGSHVDVCNDDPTRNEASEDTELPGWIEHAGRLEPNSLVVSRLDGTWVSRESSGLVLHETKTSRGNLRIFGRPIEGIHKDTTIDTYVPSPLYRGIYHFALGIGEVKKGAIATPRFVVSLDLDHAHIAQYAKERVTLPDYETAGPTHRQPAAIAKTARDYLQYYFEGTYMFIADDRGWVVAHPKPWHIVGRDSTNAWPPSMNAIEEDGVQQGGDYLEGDYPLNVALAGQELKKMKSYYDSLKLAICKRGSIPVDTADNLANVTRMVVTHPIEMNSGNFHWHELAQDDTVSHIRASCAENTTATDDTGPDNLFGLLVAGVPFEAVAPGWSDATVYAPYLALMLTFLSVLTIVLVVPEAHTLLKCAVAAGNWDEEQLQSTLGHSPLVVASSKATRHQVEAVLARIREGKQQRLRLEHVKAWMSGIPSLVSSALESRMLVSSALAQLQEHHGQLVHLAVDFDDAAPTHAGLVVVQRAPGRKWSDLLGEEQPTIYYEPTPRRSSRGALLEYNAEKNYHVLSSIAWDDAAAPCQTFSLEIRGKHLTRRDLELRVTAVALPGARRFWSLSILAQGIDAHEPATPSIDYEDLIWRLVERGVRISQQMEASGQQALRQALIPHLERIADDLHMMDLVARTTKAGEGAQGHQPSDLTAAIEKISCHAQSTKQLVSLLLNTRFASPVPLDIVATIARIIAANGWRDRVEFDPQPEDHFLYHIAADSVETIVSTLVGRALHHDSQSEDRAERRVTLGFRRRHDISIECRYGGALDRMSNSSDWLKIELAVRVNGGQLDISHEADWKNIVTVRFPPTKILERD